MVVRQRAINKWPYLGTIIERINEAADNKTVEAFDEIFLDAAKVVEEQRKVVTVNELEEQLKPLKRKLDLEIQWYTYHLKDARNKARRLKNPINRNGKPLKESTLKTYRSIVANWPEKQEAFKKDIKAMSNKLKSMSNHKGKTITRGNVSLRLIYGGEYPAKYEREFDQGWQAIR